MVLWADYPILRRIIMICKKCGQKVPHGDFCSKCGWKQDRSLENKADLSLEEVYQRWKKQHFRRITQKTREGYELAWGRLKQYGAIRLRDLDINDFQEAMDALEGMSYSYQHQLRTLISQICKWGQMHEIIRVNFAPFLILDAKKGKERNIFTDGEIFQLIEYAEDKGNPYFEDARIIITLIFTGWRPEELFHLKREDVDMINGYMLGGSKTKAGKKRIVPVSAKIRKYILEWYLRSAPGDYLVKSPTGKKMNLRNWRRRKFYPLLSDLGMNDFYYCGIPEYTPRLVPYSCRHTFASLCFRANMKPEILTKIIGHTDFEFTNKTYIHQQIPEFSEEILKVDNLLRVYNS